jgi:hypothetical protein
MSTRPTMQDLGIDKLPQEDQLALAHEILDTICGPPFGVVMTEEEIIAECERRDREMDEHPERVLSLEQLRQHLERHK